MNTFDVESAASASAPTLEAPSVETPKATRGRGRQTQVEAAVEVKPAAVPFKFGSVSGITPASLAKVESDYKSAKGRIRDAATRYQDFLETLPASDDEVKRSKLKSLENAFDESVITTEKRQVPALAAKLVKDYKLSQKDADIWIAYSALSAAFVGLRKLKLI